jgi:hypothetical protein
MDSVNIKQRNWSDPKNYKDMNQVNDIISNILNQLSIESEK